MPEISLRAEQMPASPIRKLVPLADAARARGTKIYHLNIGQPDLPSPKEGLESLKHIDRKVLEYSPSDGYRSLREKLVTYYEQYQIKLSPEEIIVTTGGSEAVLFAFMSCLNPGDEIIVPEPAYANYMAFAISAGAVIRPVVASIENGFALPPIEEFEKLINDRTRGILICNPNNPTGYLYTRREMMQIRDLVKRYDLFLFSDEVYREFIYTGSPYISACHLEGIEQNVVLIDSVSKRYSECGIRIGALITKNRAEVLPGAAVAAARGADRRRGVDRCAARVPYGGVRRVYRPPQVSDRRSEPPAGRLFADPHGCILHRGAAADRRQRPFLRVVPRRIRLRGRDGDAGSRLGVLLRPDVRSQRGAHRLCALPAGFAACDPRAGRGAETLSTRGDGGGVILPERLENGILRDSVFRSLKGRMSVRMRRTMIPPVSCGGIVQRAVSQIEITLFEVNIDFQELFGVICCCFYMSVVQCEK